MLKVSKNIIKLLLKQFFQRMRVGYSLMIWLGKNLLYENKPPFFFQKKANTILLANIIVAKVAYINFNLALIPVSKTNL